LRRTKRTLPRFTATNFEAFAISLMHFRLLRGQNHQLL
jgi:hypothetical protein